MKNKHLCVFFTPRMQRFPPWELACYTRASIHNGRPGAVRIKAHFLHNDWLAQAIQLWARVCCLWCGVIFLSNPVLAAIEVHEFTSETERERYQSFIDEMRCPKCQNQNLSGSDSPIAKDLRNELYAQIKEGRSDKEIVDFMVARYGEFILYKPRLTPATLALWSLPVIILVLGAGVLLAMLRRRRLASDSGPRPLSTDEQARLDVLLKERSSDHFNDPNNSKESRE